MAPDKVRCANCGQLYDSPRALRRPCWHCHGTVGCINCYPDRPERRRCPNRRCQVFLNSLAFVRHGPLLTRDEFNRYPTIWRLAYWAVTGSAEPQFANYVQAFERQHERQLRRLRSQLGLEPPSEPIALRGDSHGQGH